jgi:sodium-independent sulfate anion transporter 11
VFVTNYLLCLDSVMIYALFATSKDVTIGPVAVMSLEVARVIAHVQDKTGDLYSAPEIATAVAFLCGFRVVRSFLLFFPLESS